MSVKQDLIDGEIWAAQQRRKMGAKQFEEWVKSLEIRKYTIFKNNEEIEKNVKNAGYDFKIIYTNKYMYVKTHLKDYEIYWMYEGNKMYASFPSDIDKRIMNKFISDVESATGMQCFFDDISLTNEQKYNFPTIFTDKDVLRQALNNLKVSYNESKNKFSFKIPNCSISLNASDNNPYNFEAIGYADLKDIHKCFKKIENEYEHVTQMSICNNIKTKLSKSPTMQLVQEEVLEDNSVLLTISV